MALTSKFFLSWHDDRVTDDIEFGARRIFGNLLPLRIASDIDLFEGLEEGREVVFWGVDVVSYPSANTQIRRPSVYGDRDGLDIKKLVNRYNRWKVNSMAVGGQETFTLLDWREDFYLRGVWSTYKTAKKG